MGKLHRTIDEKLIGALYHDALHGGDWKPALDRLRGLLGSADAALTFTAPGVIDSHTTNRILTPEARRRYIAHFGALDPKSALFANRRADFLFNDIDHFDEEFVRRNAFYQEFSAPIDSRHTIDLLLEKDGARAGYLAAVRSARQGPFERGAVQLFRQASRHFLQVARLRRRLVESEQSLVHAAAALDSLSFGLVVLDAAGAVVMANAAACAAAAAPERGLLLTGARLGARSPAADRALGTAIGAVLRGGTADVLRVPHAEGAWFLSVAPLAPGSPIAPHGRPGALVVIADAAQGHGARADDLVTLYGLTKAEADLALAVARGGQLREIAARRGVKFSTVRSQLLSVLQKMQLRRQADLSRVLSGLPGVFLRR